MYIAYKILNNTKSESFNLHCDFSFVLEYVLCTYEYVLHVSL